MTGRNGDPDAVGTDFVRTGFYRTKAAAEAESAFKAGWRASERMAEELASPLDGVRKSVGAGLVRMKQGGLNVESLEFSTTASFWKRVRVDIPHEALTSPGARDCRRQRRAMRSRHARARSRSSMKRRARV